MRISLISVIPPSLGSGSNARNFYLLKGLSKKFHAKSYTPDFNRYNFEENPMSFLQRMSFIIKGKVPYIELLEKASFDQKTIKEIESSDIIQLAEMNAFYFYRKYLKNFKGKVILDTHNIDYLRFLSETDNKGIIEKIAGKFVALKLKKEEIKAIRKVDQIIVCSDVEKEYYKKYTTSKKITVIPNGVECSKFINNSKIRTKEVLFMGLLIYPPNSSGIKHYINNVHPLIKRVIPEYKLIILGKGCPVWLTKLAATDEAIEIKGYVKDVRLYISRASLCICPIYSGSGTRLKVLEYMAMNKTVVSSIKGAEGIDVTNGKDIFLTNNDKAFACTIIKLMDNPKLIEKIGRNARKLVERKYDWKLIQQKIITLYMSI